MSSNRFKSTLGIWIVYRKYEKLGIIKSLYYIFMHVMNAIKIYTKSVLDAINDGDSSEIKFYSMS